MSGLNREDIAGLPLTDFDVCACGDYRRDHKDGTGACVHNKPGDMTHGYEDCVAFRLSRPAVEIPEPFRTLHPKDKP